MKKNIVSRRSLAVVVLSLIGFMLPATVAWSKPAPPPSGPKLYSVVTTIEETTGDALAFTVTITNLPQSSAVLGSVNITLQGFSTISLGDLTTSAGKVWSKGVSGTTIKLRAVGDMQKLNPGQFVSIAFTAIPPSVAGAVTIGTAAKASRDFSGSSNFTRVGSDAVVVVCPDEPAPCVGTLGSTTNALADHQTGQVTLNDGCTGCILTITETAGTFCQEFSEEYYALESSPSDCRSPFVVQFNVIGGEPGDVTVILTCDVSDCPVIVDEGGGDASVSYPDFYPVWFTESDTGDTATLIDQECGGIDDVGPPCIESNGRTSSNDYTSEVHLFIGSDPRIGY